MTPERWPEVERIFHAARACEGAARVALIDKECHGDDELRYEVQSLLDANIADGFLESPAINSYLKTGYCLGQYEIVSELGAGGMGEVWRAWDTLLHREVAIKVLRTEHARDAERMRRFEQEARAAGMLNHSNIVVVHAIGNERGSPYLVTELLDGETLKQHLERERPPVRRAIEYAIQIARGLAAAHDKNIVHRDLKPENIFVTKDSRIKILDFGLAKLLQPPAHMDGKTRSGMILGTVGYMSPEQAMGLPADARSDIFSFGLVLYELLTGKQALGNPREIPDYPVLEKIFLRCTEKRAEDRFRSTRDLSFALEAALDGSLHSTLKRTSQLRHRSWLLAVLAFLGGVLVALLLASRLPRGPEAPSFANLTYSGRDFSPSVAPNGRTIAFSSDRDGRPRIWLKQITDGSEVPLTSGPDSSPRFSPDGAVILFVRNLGSRTSLFKVPVVGGEPRRLIDDVVEADYSPDGTEIAFIRWNLTPTIRSQIGVIKSDGSEPRYIAEMPSRRLQMPRWSPDGKHIATIDSIAGFGTDVHVTTLDGKWSVLDSKTELAISGVAWIGSGNEIVYVRGDYAASGKCELVRQALGSDKLTVLPWPHRSRSLDILDEGKIVFDTSSRRSNLREISLAGGAPRWLTRGISMDRQPAFSPDGERILFTSDRSGSTDIWQMDLRNGGVGRVIDDPADDMDPAYTPDGKSVIWTSNRSGHLEIYMADIDGGNPRRVTNDGVDAQNATMTADKKWIVYTSSHPAKRGVWKVHPDGYGAEQIARGTYFNPEVSPDGEYVLYVTSPTPALNVIRVARIEDGADQNFEIECAIRNQTQVVIGRARWRPDAKAILFIGQDDNGVHGIFEQPFAPDRNTASARRKLAAFDPDVATESLGLSPDGKRLMVASWDQLWSLMVAERIPGVVQSRSR
jgi:eukaryotic-like serine/threonine-protein kinase